MEEDINKRMNKRNIKITSQKKKNSLRKKNEERNKRKVEVKKERKEELYIMKQVNEQEKKI